MAYGSIGDFNTLTAPRRKPRPISPPLKIPPSSKEDPQNGMAQNTKNPPTSETTWETVRKTQNENDPTMSRREIEYRKTK